MLFGLLAATGLTPLLPVALGDDRDWTYCHLDRLTWEWQSSRQLVSGQIKAWKVSACIQIDARNNTIALEMAWCRRSKLWQLLRASMLLYQLCGWRRGQQDQSPEQMINWGHGVCQILSLPLTSRTVSEQTFAYCTSQSPLRVLTVMGRNPGGCVNWM